ncbi:MAG TPA: DUF1015 domain-containing protein [Tepidisphaeraceae bacterium]|jgi:uncharacterized protein (DUF1015 family)|nr:DUF1015 domain-containing protein [Tepidisphaeraceae bacterium]
MADIRPFAALRYSSKVTRDRNLSDLIAPPYDVIADERKAQLMASHPNNIVSIDLPHLPAKSVGPDEAYVGANATLQQWMGDGILVRDRRQATYPYTQSYQHNGRTFHRRGFITLVRLSPFGEGHVVPHEQTYPEAIIDRLKLTTATGLQLSPIFGLYSDPRHEVTNLLYRNLGRPEATATLDGVKNDLWSVIDAEVENQVIDLLGRKPIYIADGHHRYTMALQYQKDQIAANGGQPLPANHPANYCMFVLVGMQDDGLIVLPTHRMIGGLSGFDAEQFCFTVSEHFECSEVAVPPDHLGDFADQMAKDAPHTFALYDGTSRRLFTLKLRNLDVLKPFEPNHSDAWRRLDVAILQRYLLDEVLQPKFNNGQAPAKGYTAYADEIPKQTDGKKYQVALLLQPTPLHALEELGKHNEVMPQKSTYFYPKLATGLLMNPVR